jgi:hypothetical protein
MHVLFFWQYFRRCYRITIHVYADLNLLRDASCVALLNRNGVNQRCVSLWHLSSSSDEVNKDWSCASIAFTAGIGTSVPILGLLEKIAKSNYLLPHFCPRGTKVGRFSWYLLFEHFLATCRKSKILLKSCKNNGYFAWRFMSFMIIYCWLFLKSEIFQKQVVHKL